MGVQNPVPIPPFNRMDQELEGDRIMMVMSAPNKRKQGIVIDEPTLRCHHNPLVGTLGHVFIGYDTQEFNSRG